jgi:hypothetical protein
MDAQELKTAWVQAYRVLLNKPEYRLANHWTEKFAKYVERLDGVDAKEYCEFQIRYMIQRNMLDKLFPNILSGDTALERFQAWKRIPAADAYRDTLVRYKNQAQVFINVTKTMGEAFALSGSTVEYSPLYFGFMLWSLKHELPEELVSRARLEISEWPHTVRIFPGEYIRRIQE